MMDAARWLGIPYLPGGDSRAGADCWGLFRLVMREAYGLDIPPAGILPDELARLARAFADPAHPCRGGWHALPLAEARAGDALLFGRQPARPDHIGIHAGADRVLHCLRGIGSVCEPIERALARDWRSVTAWRHEAMT